MERLHRRSAAPLENMYGQAARLSHQHQTQGRRRRESGYRGWAPQTGQSLPAFNRNLQTAQGPCIDPARRPGQHAGETAARQQLFATPGCVAPGTDQQQAFWQHPGRQPGRCMRLPGRINQGQPATGLRQTGQRRQQQAHFALTTAVDEDFTKASLQFSIKCGMAAGYGIFRQARQHVAAPDVTSGQHFRQG